MLFGFDNYYPWGGIDDLVGTYDTMEEALAVLDTLREDNGQVVDTQSDVCRNFYKNDDDVWVEGKDE